MKGDRDTERDNDKRDNERGRQRERETDRHKEKHRDTHPSRHATGKQAYTIKMKLNYAQNLCIAQFYLFSLSIHI